MHIQTRTRQIVCLLIALTLVGCSRRDRRNYNDNSSIIFEQEPNGNSDNPDFIGTIRAGDRFRIDGHVRDSGSDIFDGFAFVTAEPLVIEVTLFADNVFADLDFCVYDPDFDEFIACFDGEDDPEEGTFLVDAFNQEFHIVVESHFGDSGYLLEVNAFASAFAPAATDLSAESGGSTIRLTAPQHSTKDARDRSAYQPAAESAAAADEPSVRPEAALLIEATSDGRLRRTPGMVLRAER